MVTFKVPSHLALSYIDMYPTPSTQSDGFKATAVKKTSAVTDGSPFAPVRTLLSCRSLLSCCFKAVTKKVFYAQL